MLAAFPNGVVAVDGGEVTTTSVEGVTCLSRAADERLVGTTDGAYALADRPERRFAGHVTAVRYDPRSDVWWLGTEPTAVYRSPDGESWGRLPDLTTLASSDEWSFPPRPHTHHVRWLEPDPVRDGRWYVAVEAGALIRTDDAGATWRDRVSGARRDTHELAVHPETGRLYCAAGDGYAESTDGGRRASGSATAGASRSIPPLLRCACSRPRSQRHTPTSEGSHPFIEPPATAGSGSTRSRPVRAVTARSSARPPPARSSSCRTVGCTGASTQARPGHGSSRASSSRTRRRLSSLSTEKHLSVPR